MGLVKTKDGGNTGQTRLPTATADPAPHQPGLRPRLTPLAPAEWLQPGASQSETWMGGRIDLADPAALQDFVTAIENADAAMRSRLAGNLKTRSLDLAPLLGLLLTHREANLRLFGIGLLEFRRVPDVEQQLIDLIERDEDLRVCASALDLLCEVGTEAALEPLEHLKARFAPDAYIQFAVALAIDRIREPS